MNDSKTGTLLRPFGNLQTLRPRVHLFSAFGAGVGDGHFFGNQCVDLDFQIGVDRRLEIFIELVVFARVWHFGLDHLVVARTPHFVAGLVVE